MKKIVLIDGHNLLFRMFYGIPAPIRNSKGKDIRALIGFIGSLKKIASEFKPFSLYVIFDSETSKKNNLTIDSTYKANRMDYSKVAEEENPFSQLPLIKKALEYLNIDYLEVEENETDDFIASIVSRNSKDCQYIIVSTDSDFIQLVDENTFLYVPRGKKSVLYNHEEVLKRYKIEPSQYVLFKSLVGDKGDNIKGIKGIGKVRASKIVSFYSIHEFIISNSNSKYSNTLLLNEKVIEKNSKLITMKKDLDASNITFKKLSNHLLKDKTYEVIQKIKEN